MKKILIGMMLLLWVFALSSCEELVWDEIVNPEANFVFYHWKTCPHCIALNKTLIEKDIYSKNILAKKEVWYNKANQAEFNTLTTSLGLAPEDVWVPFLYDKTTKQHYVGETKIVPVLEAAIANMWWTETTIDAQSEVRVESKSETLSESAAKTEWEDTVENESEVIVESESETLSESVAKTELEVTDENESEVIVESESETLSESATTNEWEVTDETQSETIGEWETKTESEVTVEAKATIDTELGVDVNTLIESEAKVIAQ